MESDIHTTHPKTGWLARLRAGLEKTSAGLSGGIAGIFTRRKLDSAMLEELEELLIMADMGAGVARRIVGNFAKERFDKEISPQEVKEALAEEITKILEPVARGIEIDPHTRPHVVLVVGVNGNGKTTTMGKLAYRITSGEWRVASGEHPRAKVVLAAADTFRAAAVEQLKIWGARAGVPVIAAEENADPASVAYRALEQAQKEHADIVMIDTAGRLHNKQNLMQELEKVVRVLKKLSPDAPHTVLLVLDGTTGQNALSQVEAFKALIAVNGLVVTKLDGTAKGGVVVALAETFNLPIHAIGVGEAMEDLQPFNARAFARGLVGL